MQENEMPKKDFFERLSELVKEDKELHDATVRVLNSFAEMEHERAEALKLKNEQRKKDLHR